MEDDVRNGAGEHDEHEGDLPGRRERRRNARRQPHRAERRDYLKEHLAQSQILKDQEHERARADDDDPHRDHDKCLADDRVGDPAFEELDASAATEHARDRGDHETERRRLDASRRPPG